MYDLILKGGRLLDPSQGRDGQSDIAFENGRVAAIGEHIDSADAREVRDVSSRLVTPGLIDLHTHIYWGGTSLGVDPVRYARQAGTTTMVDAGSAGPGNFHGFRAHVIERTEPRIHAYLNISYAGIFAFSHEVMVGECGDFRLLHPRSASMSRGAIPTSSSASRCGWAWRRARARAWRRWISRSRWRTRPGCR